MLFLIDYSVGVDTADCGARAEHHPEPSSTLHHHREELHEVEERVTGKNHQPLLLAIRVGGRRKYLR